MSAPPFPSHKLQTDRENSTNNNSTTTPQTDNGWRTSDHSAEAKKTEVPSVIPGQPPTPVELGNSGWNILHSAAAVYPYKPTDEQKDAMEQFIHGWSFAYACNWCAYHMRTYLKENPPIVEDKHALTQYMCRFHNRVNEHLKKPQYDCDDIDGLLKRWHPGYPDRMEDKPSWESRIDAELAKMKQVQQAASGQVVVDSTKQATTALVTDPVAAKAERANDFFLFSVQKGEQALAAALSEGYQPSSLDLEQQSKAEVADHTSRRPAVKVSEEKSRLPFRPKTTSMPEHNERKWGESAHEVAGAMSQHFHSTFAAPDPKGVFAQLSSWWRGSPAAENTPSSTSILSVKADVEKRALEMGEHAMKAARQFSEFQKPPKTPESTPAVEVTKKEVDPPVVHEKSKLTAVEEVNPVESEAKTISSAPAPGAGSTTINKTWWSWDSNATPVAEQVEKGAEKVEAVVKELQSVVETVKAEITSAQEKVSAIQGQAKKEVIEAVTTIGEQAEVLRSETASLTQQVLKEVEQAMPEKEVITPAPWWGWWWTGRSSSVVVTPKEKTAQEMTEKELELLHKKEEMSKAAAQYTQEAMEQSHKGEEKKKEHTKAYNKAADLYREAARQNLEKLAEKAEEELDLEQGVAVKKSLAKAAEAVKDYSEEQKKQLQQYGEEYYQKSMEYRKAARKHLDDLVSQAQTYAAQHKEAMSEHAKMYAKAAEQYEEAGKRHAAALLESASASTQSNISEKVRLAEEYRAAAKKKLEDLGAQAKKYADEHHTKLSQHQEAFSKAAEQYREASRLRALQVAEHTKALSGGNEEMLQRAEELANDAKSFYDEHNQHIQEHAEAYKKAANEFLSAAQVHLSDLSSISRNSVEGEMNRVKSAVKASMSAMENHTMEEVSRVKDAAEAVSAHMSHTNAVSDIAPQNKNDEVNIMEIMKKLNDCDIYCPEKDLLNASPLYKKKS